MPGKAEEAPAAVRHRPAAHPPPEPFDQHPGGMAPETLSAEEVSSKHAALGLTSPSLRLLGEAFGLTQAGHSRQMYS